MTWIIQKVNGVPTHCGVAYESVHLLAKGHVISVILLNLFVTEVSFCCIFCVAV